MKPLDGFLAPGHPLSPREAFRQLDPVIRRLVENPPASLWEQDTGLLPGPLQKYRRRAREFAAGVLSAHVEKGDLDPHGLDTGPILEAAGRAGFLSDLLPSPWGASPWKQMLYPLQWVQSLKMEELCAVCGGLGVLMGAHGLGTMPLILSGDLGLVRRFVIPAYRRSLKGRPYLFAFAITEPAGGSDVEDSAGAAAYRPRTVARQVEGGFVLNGRKVFISGGDVADAVTVYAALEGEGMESWTCFLVEKGMKGFSVGRSELKMGQRASAAAELIFEDVMVPDDHLIGKPRTGWANNRAVLNFSRIPVGAIALGVARGALEAATDFVCRYRLGGRPLIDYQEVQLAIAGMQADTMAMRALIWQASRPFKPLQGRASAVKVFCSDTAVRVCERAMELLGNHAVLHKNRVEKAFRDARLTQIYEGTNQINLLAVIEDQMEQLVELSEGGTCDE